MHRIIGTRILTLLFALILLSYASLGANGDEARTVSIRIHDYAHLDEAALARAQEVVSGMYGAIGVRTDWLEPLQQFDGAFDGSGARDCKASDLMIIILTSAMANRGVIPDSIIGFAASQRGAVGRIAYVIYERVKDIARGTAVDDMRIMGIVMAHEIGHLLLTNQSHSDGGLMRGRWVPSEIRSARPGDLHFSELQAMEIRKTLSGGLAP
jgi:hypothetical protein